MVVLLCVARSAFLEKEKERIAFYSGLVHSLETRFLFDPPYHTRGCSKGTHAESVPYIHVSESVGFVPLPLRSSSEELSKACTSVFLVGIQTMQEEFGEFYPQQQQQQQPVCLSVCDRVE